MSRDILTTLRTKTTILRIIWAESYCSFLQYRSKPDAIVEIASLPVLSTMTAPIDPSVALRRTMCWPYISLYLMFFYYKFNDCSYLQNNIKGINIFICWIWLTLLRMVPLEEYYLHSGRQLNPIMTTKRSLSKQVGSPSSTSQQSIICHSS